MTLSELENYRQRIDDLRQQMKNLVQNLPAEALNWRFSERVGEEAANSIAVLAVHSAGAEHFWIGEVVGGLPATRDRAAEFTARATDASALVQILEKTRQETDWVFMNLRDADLEGTRQVNDKVVAVRWAILHVVDHLSLHLGHMQITYQLWTQGRTSPSPFWYERLPKSPGK